MTLAFDDWDSDYSNQEKVLIYLSLMSLNL